MQNCPVPSKGSPYECVNRIREVVLKGEKTTEVSFNAYCDVSKLSQDTRQELARARVILRDVPSQKPAAADIRLLQDMLHHTMTHRSGIIVLISGDIDFAETVHDLVHTGGYKVILIHNRQTRSELRRNASKALEFETVVGGAVQGNKNSSTGRKDISGKKDKTGRKKESNNKNSADKSASVSSKSKKKESKQSKQPKKQWPCESCGKKFAAQESRDKHVEATGHVVQWGCDDCGKAFQSELALQQHQDATGHDQISCDECDAKFNSLRSLSQHMEATGHAAYLSWNCPICKDEPWPSLKDLLDHLRLDHV
jgi:rubrerythrin